MAESSPEARRHLEAIARGGTLALGGAIVSAGTSFLLVIIVTRGLDQAEAGQFFSGTSLFMIAMALSLLGTDSGIGRFTSMHLVQGHPGRARACWSSAVRVTLGISILTAGVAIVLREQLASIAGLTSPGAPMFLLVLAMGLPAATLANVALSATRSLATMRPTVIIERILRPSLQSGLAFATVLAGSGLVALGWSWSVPYMIGAIVTVVVTRRAARRRLAGKDVDSRHDRKRVQREFWRFTWPRSIAQISQMIIQRADIIIIGALVSPAAAAIYTASTRFIVLGQFGSQAIQQTIQPRFARLLAAERMDVLSAVYRAATTWSILVTWPSTLR